MSNKKVRTLLINDEIWFVGKDIADILEYENDNDMYSGLDDDEKRKIKNPEVDIIINESGFHHAILLRYILNKKGVYNMYNKFRMYKNVLEKTIQNGIPDYKAGNDKIYLQNGHIKRKYKGDALWSSGFYGIFLALELRSGCDNPQGLPCGFKRRLVTHLQPLFV